MQCPNCGTDIPASERYCRNCGHDTLAMAQTLRAPTPTQPYSPTAQTGAHSFDASAKTEVLHAGALPTTGAQSPLSTAQPARRSPLLVALVVACVLLFLSIGGVLAYFLLQGRNAGEAASGKLPDHFGIFVRRGDQLSELRRRDFRNALEGRDAISADAALTESPAQPSLILYAEAQDIPVPDLKLLQLDSLTESGQVRYWNFQVAPVEGHADMKQLRVAGGLPAGKYAFALINGYLNEGNHKFWPFEVTEGAEPGEQPQAATIPVKASPGASPTASQTQPTPKPTPNVEPPPGARLAYCNDTNVIVRSSPDLNARPVTKITKGQKLWAIGKSTTTSTWNGITSDWTQVQLYQSATRGWVFSPFVSY